MIFTITFITEKAVIGPRIASNPIRVARGAPVEGDSRRGAIGTTRFCQPCPGGVRRSEVLAQRPASRQPLLELRPLSPRLDRLGVLPGPERHEAPGIGDLADQDEALHAGSVRQRPLRELRP